MQQMEVDTQNAEFWDELCGTGLAQSLGITDLTPENLKRFDRAYLNLYPYLERYVTEQSLTGKKVLEIGLGFGTLGNLLAQQGCHYYGLDIANNPVRLMQYRLGLLGTEAVHDRVQQGSALAIPHPDSSLDFVYSIGCLHHTGNLPVTIQEVYRVLVPGGRAIIMLYHKHSFRRYVSAPWKAVKRIVKGTFTGKFSEMVRGMYDTNSVGEAAPHTDYVSRADVRRLFSGFSHVAIQTENFDDVVLLRGRVVFPRHRLLGGIAQVAGLDLYITAQK